MNVTTILAEYASSAMEKDAPSDVLARAKSHLLDTIAAMIAGTRLPAGLAALRYAAPRSGIGPVSVPGTNLSLQPADAALVNGMTAHADETDDTHALSLTHPGSVVVPAALAAAEWSGASGIQLLRAIILGYDICCRMGMALGAYEFHDRGFDTHAYAGVFGAAFAAGGLLGLSAQQYRYLASYAAQAASGLTTWVRDVHHVEKAFDFAGMPAMNGLQVAMMVRAGFTGVVDIFDGKPNFLQIVSPGASGEVLTDALGVRFEISRTTIKRWSVGSPAQASIDGLKDILDIHKVSAEDVARVTTTISDLSAKVVTGRAMPNLDIQHLLATLLVEGDLSYESTHDAERMSNPDILEARGKISVVRSNEMDPKLRHAKVRVETRDGQALERYVADVRGTPRNPMSDQELTTKASLLIGPVLGTAGAEALVRVISEAQSMTDVRSMRQALAGVIEECDVRSEGP